MNLELVRPLLRALPEPHVLLARDGSVLAANAAAVRLLGLADERPSSLPRLVFEPAEGVRSYLTACAGSGSALPGALTFELPDGVRRRLRCKAARLEQDGETLVVVNLSAAGGTAERFLHLSEQVEALSREVRERRRVEAELLRTAALLSGTVRASPLAIIGVDTELRVTLWNPAAERIFGWRADEVVGGPLPIVPPDQRLDFERRWGAISAGGELVGERSQRLRKDGTRVEVSISSAPLVDSDGEMRGAVAVLEDISERLRSEAALREREAFAERLLESSSDCVKVLDLEGRLLSMNRAGQNLMEITDLEARIGSDWLSFWPGEHREKAHGAMEAARNGGEGRFQGFCLTGRGNPRWWDVVLTPIPDAEGEVFRLLSISRDITVQKAAEEELWRAKETAESASQAKSQFLAIISHELRTPLTGIIGYADLLASDIWGPTTEEQRVQIGRIKAGAWHLVSVIEEILTFSRVEAGKEDVRPEMVDLVALARESAELLEPQAAEKGIELRVRTPGSPIAVRTDRAKARQILLNLIGNAVKFTDAGEVELAVERSDGMAIFRVRDTGPGIAREHVDRIFEPFTQIDQSHTRQKGGTGLGLAVCRRLAGLLGGEVTVEETRPGVGSVFSLRLPMVAPADPPGPPVVGAPIAGGEAGLHTF